MGYNGEVSKFLVIFLLAALASFGFFYLNRDFVIEKPVAEIYSSSGSQKNIWFPKKSDTSDRSYPDFTFSASSALLVDYDSGEVLFSKEENKRLPVASTVKIMTALVALSNAKLSDFFTVSEGAVKTGENSMLLIAGEKLTLSELLYGLMLVSGNDAAVTIAEGIAGSEVKFVQMMNVKVKDLGLSDTRFVNASGLDDDNRAQYSSAYDLAVISRYVWEKYPVFSQITSTYHKFIEATPTHQDYDLYNDTNLLTTYPGVKGIKPGFTWEAGLCLVTYAENGGKRFLGVVLGTYDRRGEMKELLDWGFGRYGIKVARGYY